MVSLLHTICADTKYLAREARFIAVTRALRHLPAAALESATDAARTRAYAEAGLADVTEAEDAEAVRRQKIYWRSRKPVPPVSAHAGDVERVEARA